MSKERKPRRGEPMLSTLPSQIELPKGDIFEAVCARVVSRDEAGRPWELRLIYPEDEVEVVEGDTFIPVYLHQKAVERRDPT